VISAAPSDTLFATLLRMKRAGRRVVLIAVGGPEPPMRRDGLTVYHIPDEVAWRDLETLGMEGG